MKIVVQTQYRENYGAHDWAGEGECPQYWKGKGGYTYVVHGVSQEQARSKEFWTALADAIEYSSDSTQEFILSDNLVDDVDYDESKVCAEWESPTNLVYAQGEFLATRYTPAGKWWDQGITAKLEQWRQVSGRRDDYVLMYELGDGRTLTYSEWVSEQEAA